MATTPTTHMLPDRTPDDGRQVPAEQTSWRSRWPRNRHAQHRSQNKARADAGQDTAQLERALAIVAGHKGDDKRHERDGPVGDAAKIGSTLPARHRSHGDRAQRQADHKDDGAEHRGRKQKAYALKQQAEKHDERAADNLSAQHGLEAELKADRLSAGTKVKLAPITMGRPEPTTPFMGNC